MGILDKTPIMLLSLDLLAFQDQLKIKSVNGQKKIFDPIRKQFYVWQPEELVRQLLLIFLINQKGYKKNRIHVERGLQINDQSKRCDIIIYDEEVNPYLLIECKSPSVAINQKVLDQIAVYNMVFKVPYLLVSNGIQSYCCEIDYQSKTFNFLNTLPPPK